MARIEGKKVAMIVDNYFEQAEFTDPKKMLEDAGAVVRVIATRGGTVQGMNHEKLGDEFKVDDTIDKADINAYDAILLPGGAINADQLRMVEGVRQATRTFLTDEKPLAVICHAPWALVSAEVVKGKTLTSYPTIQDDIKNAGGEWADQEVCVDGTLITSRQPGDVPAFTNALMDMLEKQ